MKITVGQLKKIIREESDRLSKTGLQHAPKDPDIKDAEEVEADEYAETVGHKISWQKALDIKEAKLMKKLRRLREQRSQLKD